MIYRIASCFVSLISPAILAAVMFLGPLAAAGEPEQEKQADALREQHLQNMRRSAAQYAILSADTPPQTFTFHETPHLRSSNPIGDTKDGVLFLWTHHGRPEAVLKLYTFNNKVYTHAWLSLSEGTFVGQRDGQTFWKPTEPSITWQEIPGAPLPAPAAAERLRQMKNLSAKFSATYTALRSDGKPFELRMLTQPLLRYETDDDADGALFCFVQSTASVGLLLIESRQTPNGHRWHYAFGSLTSGLVTARYGDEEVFSLERGNSYRDPQHPYLLLHGQPVPKQ